MSTKAAADGPRVLIAAGALALFVSLFLTWSHQLTGRALLTFARLRALQGVPVSADAWQVYTMVDVLLALLAGALLGVALFGNRTARAIVIAAAAAGLAFVIHALAMPPTNGVLLVNPAERGPAIHYVATGAGSGAGETIAVAGLVAALAGLALSRPRLDTCR